jgi:alpha-beta hydrolase superfamily lysophospholipase
MTVKRAVGVVALLVGIVSPALLVPGSAGAATTAYQRGPAPTWSSIQAATGPFGYASQALTDANTPSTFGAATIYYPTDTSQGTFGGVAIVPGYTEKQSAISWWGPRLASQGFVVITIDTNSVYDQPSARASELLAALDYLTGSSSVKSEVDAGRTAVMGHSMGGGGSLEATKTRKSLWASVPMEPWDTNKDFSSVTTPTMIIGAQKDTVAPTTQHAIPFYNSIGGTVAKAYLELAGATHSATNTPNTTAAEYAISWLKRFVDLDTRYQQFLCPPPATSSTISQYLSTCPYA